MNGEFELESERLWVIAHRAGQREICTELVRAFLVGPYDGDGVEVGPGFSIFVGTWRIGWWAKRQEACDEGDKLVRMIRTFPEDRGQ